jgi:hypothetical protein
MKRIVWIGVVILAASLSPAHSPVVAAAPAACATPAAPLRYPDVQPIFVKQCANCHDARLAKNDAAQAVFEMTSYPFATRRPARLLDDLRVQLPRRAKSADDKCLAEAWLSGGALDADGKPPAWR